MAAITTGVISAGMAGYQIYQGAEQKKKAQNALNNYERQELDNAFEDIQISTMGSDLIREENQGNTATAMDVISQAGDRAIIGGVPRLVANTNDANREAQKYLDDQVLRREYAIAGDNARIEGITENRDVANINALGEQYQAGNQDMWSGIMGMGSSLAYGARNIKGGGVTEVSGTELPEQFQTNGSSANPNSPYNQGEIDPNFSTPFNFATSYQAPPQLQGSSGNSSPYNPFSFNGYVPVGSMFGNNSNIGLDFINEDIYGNNRRR